MNRKIFSFAVVAVSMVPAAASAQACFGFPQGIRTAVVAEADFMDGATRYGASGLFGAAPNIWVGAEAGITAIDDEGEGDSDNPTRVGGNVGFELPVPAASVCPNVGVVYEWVEGFNVLSVPVGVALGTTLPLGSDASMNITPFVHPQFVWARFSPEGFDSDTDTQFQGTAGATLGFDRFVVGASVNKVFEDDTDVVIGIHGGFAL